MAQHKFDWIKHSDAVADDRFALTQEDLDKVYRMDHPEIQKRLTFVRETALPSAYKLANMPSVKDQGDLGLCFAFAGAGIQQYYYLNNPTIKSDYDLSEMFLGYWSRYICEGGAPTGDNGSTIIATMQAQQQYGICLEKTWTYVDAKENIKPSDVAVKEASQYEVGKYFAIDEDANVTTNIKKSIYAGTPIMYGSEVHQSIDNVGTDGIEPYAKSSSTSDPVVGGHARWIYGWDDTKTIKGTTKKGAFLVRNSWGGSWGCYGDSWVSYQVFLDQETDPMGITSAIAPTNTPTPSPNLDPTADIKLVKNIVYGSYNNATKISKIKNIVSKY